MPSPVVVSRKNLTRVYGVRSSVNIPLLFHCTVNVLDVLEAAETKSQRPISWSVAVPETVVWKTAAIALVTVTLLAPPLSKTVSAASHFNVPADTVISVEVTASEE